MRIVYLSQARLPSERAHSVHIMRMCSALARAGCDVELIAHVEPGFDAQRLFEHYGVSGGFAITGLALGNHRGAGLIYAFRAARMVQSRGADWIYGRNVMACWFATRIGSTPVAYEAHDSPHKSTSLHQRLYRSLLLGQRLDALVAVSGALGRHLEECAPGWHGRILTAHDGADIGAEEAPDAEPDNDASLQVAYTGSFYPGRGIDLILALAKACPWASFHLAGGSPEQLRELGSIGELTNLKVYGFLKPVEVPALLAKADVALAPYTANAQTPGGSESARWMSPMKIFEYMAAGMAIIASDLPVLREIIRNGEDALLMPPKDIGRWIGALAQLRDDPAMRRRLGLCARQRLKTEFTWDERARNILSHLKAGNSRASSALEQH